MANIGVRGQISFERYTHSGPSALPGPLKWSLKITITTTQLKTLEKSDVCHAHDQHPRNMIECPTDDHRTCSHAAGGPPLDSAIYGGVN